MSTYSISSDQPLAVRDNETAIQYTTFNKGHAAALWREYTHDGYFYAIAELSSRDIYEFALTSIGTCDWDRIVGLWEVKRNGTLVCDGCVGVAEMLGQQPGNYFKIYIGDHLAYRDWWLFSGYITNRFDF
jgi:hypothetical protein